MDYVQYIGQVRARASAPNGRKEIYVGTLMAANVVAALTGSGISGMMSDYTPLFKGEIVDPDTIEDIINIPGVAVSVPSLPSSSYGFVRAGQLMPGPFRKPFNFKYIPQMGNDYLQFMKSLIGVYKERLFPTKLLSAAEQMKISRVLDAGFIVMPINSNARGDKWNAIVQEFDKANILYRSNMVKEGQAALDKSRANLKFWNAMLVITQAAAAPITAITDAASFGFNYRKPLIFAGMGFLAWIAYNKAKKVKRFIS